MRRQTEDGMTQFLFFERAPYTWLRDEHGQRTGLCRDGRCLYFVDCLEESCPVPLLDTSDARLVTVSCLYSAGTAPAGRESNVEQPHSEALGTGALTPLGQNNIFTGQTDGGVRATLPNAGKRPDGSFTAAVKEFVEQLTLEDCLKKLQQISIPPEWLKKGIALFIALGIVVHAALVACELLDRMGNWLLDAAAAGLGRLWRRARQRFGRGKTVEAPSGSAAGENPQSSPAQENPQGGPTGKKTQASAVWEGAHGPADPAGMQGGNTAGVPVETTAFAGSKALEGQFLAEKRPLTARPLAERTTAWTPQATVDTLSGAAHATAGQAGAGIPATSAYATAGTPAGMGHSTARPAGAGTPAGVSSGTSQQGTPRPSTFSEKPSSPRPAPAGQSAWGKTPAAPSAFGTKHPAGNRPAAGLHAAADAPARPAAAGTLSGATNATAGQAGAGMPTKSAYATAGTPAGTGHSTARPAGAGTPAGALRGTSPQGTPRPSAFSEKPSSPRPAAAGQSAWGKTPAAPSAFGTKHPAGNRPAAGLHAAADVPARPAAAGTLSGAAHAAAGQAGAGMPAKSANAAAGTPAGTGRSTARPAGAGTPAGALRGTSPQGTPRPSAFSEKPSSPRPAADDGRLSLRGIWDDLPLGDGSAPDTPRPAPREESGLLAKLRRMGKNT